MNARNVNRRSLLLPAALLGAGLIIGGMYSEVVGPTKALAQTTPSSDPPFNAAEQRKQIIEQLKQLNDKVTRVEAKLDKGINVKVTEMPPVIVKESGK